MKTLNSPCADRPVAFLGPGVFHQPTGIQRGKTVLFLRTRKRLTQRLGLDHLAGVDVLAEDDTVVDPTLLRRALNQE